MNPKKIQLTERDKDNLLRIAKVVDKGDEALIEEIFNLERQVELVVKALNDGMQYAVKLSETTQRLPGPKGETGVRGLPGENYNLKEQDIERIAQLSSTKVKVPIVEKVIIEKTEIIKEQPIIKTEIIEKIVKELDTSVIDAKIAELESEITRLKNIPRPLIGGGRAGIQILNNGSKVGTKSNEVNFTTGLTVTDSNGRINVAASVGLTFLTPQDYPDGGRVDFIFLSATSQPTWIIADGVWLHAASDDGQTTNWTWDSDSLTATMPVPPINSIRAIQ